ncbi:MAG: DNA polymerase III subunit gamma/tau [Lewinellaceae bacterium]|nr:DNA polymerase III subunit gamma/tau [Lewinellaceae bacterium]
MGNFVVSARKYRPARFEDVVGQEHVTNTLKNALRNDHLAHAFLFCGPRGVGKTTCARILAKVLNCERPGTELEPCNECSSCSSFNENASFNITELDAASNNSVEHIRALIEQVRFQPQQGQYKVFIIDEVHMLSQQAFNAFLKTLEEPPPYAIFILATTEKHKIIPTILSRCQIFDFKRIQAPAMVSHLQAICQQESIEADEDALHVIAQKADGALRDALSIFDRIVSYSGAHVRYEDVITNLNVLDYDYFFQLVEALLAEDHRKVLLLFDEVLNKGFDADLFINGLAEHLRNLLVAKDPQTLILLELTEGLRERYQLQAALVNTSFLLTTMNLANECDINFKLAHNKRLHVEMTLIKMAYAGRAIRIAQGQDTALIPEKKKTDVAAGVPQAPLAVKKMPSPEQQASAPTQAESSPATQPVPTVETQAEATASAAEQPHAAAPPPPPPTRKRLTTPRLDQVANMLAEVKAEAQIDTPVSFPDLTLESLTETWTQFIGRIEQETVRNLLQGIAVTLEEDHHIVARVSSSLVENTLRQERHLMDSLRTHFGRKDLILRIAIDKSTAPEPPKIQKPLTSKEKLLVMYEKNPGVKQLAETFNLRIDED